MTVSPHFNHFGHSGTQELSESLYTEAIKQRGVDIKYIKRSRLNDDTILGDSDVTRFEHWLSIEMAITDITAFNGDGDVFAKFGIDLSDTMSWEVSRSRFKAEAFNHPEFDELEPEEGDLIYLPISNSLWEITKVKGDADYYIHGTKNGFRLSTSLFEYSHEEFDTGDEDLDSIEDVSSTVSGLIAEIEQSEGIKHEIVAEVIEDDLLDDDEFDPTGDIL